MSGTRGEGLRRIEKEIAGEKAAALGRAGERLEQMLTEARAAAARLLAARDDEAFEHGGPTTQDPQTPSELAQAYASARRRALDARLALLIQREALGLRRHATVDQQFPEPPTVEALVGRPLDMGAPELRTPKPPWL